jgi:hypothetical protein
MKKKAWQTFLLTIGFISSLSVLILLVIYALSPRLPDNLRKHATRVADATATKNWVKFAGQTQSGPDHFWFNDHEILYCVTNPSEYLEEGSRILALLDIHTGKTRFLQTKAGNATLSSGDRIISISPDGKYLLGEGAKLGTPLHLFTLALDGSGKRHTWPLTFNTFHTYWEADSRSFVRFKHPAFGRGWQARRYRLDSPGKAPEVIAETAFPAPPPELNLSGPLGPNVYLAYTTGPNLPSGIRQFLATTLPSSTSGAAVASIPWRKVTFLPPPPTAPLLKLPSSIDVIPQASPQGDRLLWCIERVQPQPRFAALTNFFYRLLPPLQHVLQGGASQQTPLYEIWISKAGGMAPKLLGTLPPEFIPPSPTSSIGGFVPSASRGSAPVRVMGASLQTYSMSPPIWLPDGKQIAFWQEGALYVAPVPEK